MQATLRRLYDWMGNMVYSQHALLLLGMLFYFEAIMFFPVEPILILYCLQRRENTVLYAAIATLASVLGGLTSYCIGYLLWQSLGHQIVHNTIVNYMVAPATFYKLCELYKANQWWALLMIGFSPIPFKAATLTAGFCRLSVLPFLICACIVRGTRFFVCALVTSIWGKQVKEYIDRYVNHLVLFILFIIFLVLWLLK